jgi:hypothetical protein
MPFKEPQQPNSHGYVGVLYHLLNLPSRVDNTKTLE